MHTFSPHSLPGIIFSIASLLELNIDDWIMKQKEDRMFYQGPIDNDSDSDSE